MSEQKPEQENEQEPTGNDPEDVVTNATVETQATPQPGETPNEH